MITSLVPLMHIPGRMAALVVATILLRGLWHNNEESSLIAANVAAQEQESSDPTRMLMIDKHLVTATSNLRAGSNVASSSLSVSVQVSIESLCIDSKNYILNELVPTFATPLADVMDLEVVVFGNARLHTASQTVTCQHGNAECDANVYQQCAIDNYEYPARYLPFLACLFQDLPMGHADTPYDVSYFATCARHAALDFRALQACHTQDAWGMQVTSAAKTPSDHDHVPWVVIDGTYVPEDQSSLSYLVCQALHKKGGTNAFCDTL